ncbi:hypothetical protein SAMN02745112_00011 [Clostridium tetani]|nr:hypothetical protein SAMN02745112_00011 [Clostridium tetani]
MIEISICAESECHLKGCALYRGALYIIESLKKLKIKVILLTSKIRNLQA